MEKEANMKTLGQAIDEIILALQPLDQDSRITAVRASCEHLDIPLVEKPTGATGTGAQAKGGTGSQATPHTPSSEYIVDIKTLKEQKRPTSANEMAALVAFYLSEVVLEQERKTEIDIEDMTKYFKQANFRLPKTPKQLLVNAKNAGYLDSAGGGKYKLNPVGYNLVAHNMPRTTTESATTSPRKRSKPKKSMQKAGTRKSTKKVK